MKVKDKLIPNQTHLGSIYQLASSHDKSGVKNEKNPVVVHIFQSNCWTTDSKEPEVMLHTMLVVFGLLFLFSDSPSLAFPLQEMCKFATQSKAAQCEPHSNAFH